MIVVPVVFARRVRSAPYSLEGSEQGLPLISVDE